MAKVRLWGALGVLAVWVGYLAYQAVAFGRFPVVSHAQLLVSTLDVVADVRADASGAPDPKVRVVEVLWPARNAGLAGHEIVVVDLPKLTTIGFRGAGRYILPLIRGAGEEYAIAGLPRSPGFDGSMAHYIYADTPLALKQYASFAKPTPAPDVATAVK